MDAIEKACYWFSTTGENAAAEPLKQDVECDVAIVGGGFTGFWTAYFLQRLAPETSVAVVEQAVAGYGASGRNAGIVSPCLDHSHALAIAHFGHEEAARLARLGLENVNELGEFAVDCDFVPSGVLHVALNDEHVRACREMADVADWLGLADHDLLNAEQTRAQLNSPLYVGGLQVNAGGIINPLKLITKLKREFLANGGMLFENTRVQAEEHHRLVTAGGTITARRIVLATDAYTHQLFPQLLSRFIPLYDYILVSRPLQPDELAGIGWYNRQGVTDGRTFFNYYRLTADNRILWGTSEAVYYPPNRVGPDCDHSQRHYDSLRASFTRHFPQLASLEFEYAWGGPIASTTRLTPFFGTMHGGDTMYALGYTGHGIGTTRVAGKILAHMALSTTTDLLDLKMVCQKPFPYPPEPLRSLAVNLVTRSLQKVDAGEKPNVLLGMLDALGIGFSS
jgi:glycine/D-amino acid oxidase-like deaminating enzyme